LSHPTTVCPRGTISTDMCEGPTPQQRYVHNSEPFATTSPFNRATEARNTGAWNRNTARPGAAARRDDDTATREAPFMAARAKGAAIRRTANDMMPHRDTCAQCTGQRTVFGGDVSKRWVQTYEQYIVHHQRLIGQAPHNNGRLTAPDDSPLRVLVSFESLRSAASTIHTLINAVQHGCRGSCCGEDCV